MTAIVAIGWALGLLVSVVIVHATIGNHGLVQMFPEGHRWWMPWSRLAALCLFAAAVLANPFNGWLAHVPL